MADSSPPSPAAASAGGGGGRTRRTATQPAAGGVAATIKRLEARAEEAEPGAGKEDEAPSPVQRAREAFEPAPKPAAKEPSRVQTMAARVDRDAGVLRPANAPSPPSQPSPALAARLKRFGA